MKINMFGFLFFLVFINNHYFVNAQENTNYEFIITATNPTNGESNVPTNLKDGNCQNQYCALIVGLGNSDKSPKGQGYPFLVQDSLSSSAIQISGPNYPSQIKVMGSSEGGNEQNFYHSNSLFLFNSSGNLYYLEPNSTYTITFKSGINGIKAQYSSNTIAYLASDYSFSFTTGSGPTKTDADFPTVTRRNTPSPRQQSQIVYSPTSTLIPTIKNKPTITPTTTKKQLITTVTPTPQITIENTPTPSGNFIQESPTTKKVSWWNKIKIFWIKVFNNFKKQKNHSEVADVTPTVQPPTPTQIESTPIPTSTPTTKLKPKPTIINKPVSVVDENVLKTKFGINSPDLITIILNDLGKLESYEREYYNQLKGWPELNTTATEQRIYIPSLNTTKICKTTNIIEIKNAVINVENLKGKSKSVLMKRSEAKPLIKVVFAEESLDKQIENLTKDYNIAKDTLNELLGKYCR